MKIKSFKAKGIGWLHNEISLPIDELGDASIIAVTGLNGVGKSTLLECIPGLLYGNVPSHGPVAAMASAKDSYIEGMFETDQLYRARRTINATLKKPKIEAYLWDENGIPVGASDGKQGTFADEIIKHFPSERVYLSSGFASQAKVGQFLEIPKSERKALFADIIGLDDLQRLSKIAGERAKTAEGELTELRAKMAALKEQADRISTVKSDHQDAEKKFEDAGKNRKQAEQDFASAREKLETWQKKATEIERELAAAEVAARETRREREHVDAELAKAQKSLDEIMGRVDRVAARAETVTNNERVLFSAREAREKMETKQVRAQADMEIWQQETSRFDQAAMTAETAQKEALRQRDRLTEEMNRIKEELTKSSAKRASIQTRLSQRERFQNMLVNAKDSEKIPQIEAQIRALREQDTAYRAAEKKWREQYDEAEKELRLCREIYRQAVIIAEAEAQNVQRDLKELEKSASGLDVVPCHGDGKYAVCPLLATAIESNESIEGARLRVEEAEANLNTVKADTGVGFEAKIALEALGEAPKPPNMSEIDRLDGELGHLRKDQAKATEARVQLDAMGETEKQAIELDTGMAGLRIKLEAISLSVADAHKGVSEADENCVKARNARSLMPSRPEPVSEFTLRSLRENETELVAVLAKAREALVTAEREAKMAKIHRAELESQVSVGQDTLAAATLKMVKAKDAMRDVESARCEHGAHRPCMADESELRAIRRRETEAAGELARTREALDAAERAAGQVRQIAGDILVITADFDDWKHLQKALGREGIQSLEVDAAGPEVSSLINELLHSCYGPRFVAKLETTTPKADGKGSKEIFDLHVLDTEKGWEGSASHLSGGERVIVAEALGLAIAIYNTQQSSIPILDLMRDECSGGLDFEKAPLYVTMLRRAVELGKFHRVWFISHQRDLWAMADAVVEVKDGHCRVAEAA